MRRVPAGFAFALALALLAMVARPAPGLAGTYSGLYVFGDSLSDVGNVSLATNGAEPAAPYFQGRFSNGPNWADDLAQSLALGPVLPSLAGGNDFAFGGAVTGPSVPGASTAGPNIVQQVGLFSRATGGVAPSTGLYTVWIGGNDVDTALDDLIAGTLTLSQATADLLNSVQTETGAIAALAGEGAKTFLVPLVPDLGKTPNAIEVGVAAAATALSQGYNAALVASLAGLAAVDGLTVHTVDTFALIDSAVANPSAFGFTDVTDRCYVGSLFGGGTVCATPGTYLFWDGQHPTAATDVRVADTALAALPEPTTALLLLSPVALALLSRRIVRHR